MTIPTKAEIGDKVYFLKNNKINSGTIDSIYLTLKKDKKTIEYFVGAAALEENDIFVLSSDLIDDLLMKGDR